MQHKSVLNPFSTLESSPFRCDTLWTKVTTRWRELEYPDFFSP